MTPEQLPPVLASVEGAATDRSFLVVSRTEPPPPLEQYFPEDSRVEWLCHVYTADDIVAVDRADLGLVFDQIEHMDRAESTHLLSRLRDQHCRRVLLQCETTMFTKQDLLALGYIEQPSEYGRLFLHDPERFFERREWNTPDKWAHPENFKKNRW